MLLPCKLRKRLMILMKRARIITPQYQLQKPESTMLKPYSCETTIIEPRPTKRSAAMLTTRRPKISMNQKATAC